MNYPLIVITGPTAVGKTKLAVAVAAKLKGEIINADSRQVYKQMDIGTGKDLEDYTFEGHAIPYHLIDIHEAGYQYNIKEYQQDFHAVHNSLQEKNISTILCGGSGLYIESALEGNPFAFVPINQQLRDALEDESKSKLMGRLSDVIREQLHITSLTTKKRLVRAVEISEYVRDHPEQKAKGERLNADIFVLTLDRAKVLERIKTRLKHRLENGMIDEVRGLLNQGLTPEQLLYYGLEYRWITMHVIGEMTYDEMFDRLNISIRQFAKRQMTWFRRMEKRGYQLNWLDGEKSIEELSNQIVSRYQ
ncbi:MAG: tRNA (adenosine(37)-N6)-dimethylallyltransferase MiaA [Bacteroidota bacterium]